MAQSIKKSFSLLFQLQYCAVMVVVSGAASFLLYLYLNRNLSGNYLDSLRTLQHIDQGLPFYLAIFFLLQILFVLALTVVINLFVSHKIAGPVFRYEDSLNRLLEGDLRSEFRTRQNDQLKPIVTALNKVLEREQHIFVQARDIQSQLERQLGDNARGEVQLKAVCDSVKSLRSQLEMSETGDKSQ